MADAESHSHTGRIEAFSDGVFAIATTLLIIEIGVPDVHGGGDLTDKLLDLWPQYLAYALSFLTIGVYWANHHSLFRLFHTTDHYFLMLNVVFLMTIAFLPFPTAVVGDYLKDSAHRDEAMHFYAIGFILPATTWFIVWMYARYRGLLDPDLDPKYCEYLTRQYALSQVPYWAALGVSFISAWAAMAIIIGLAALYALPPKRPVYLHPHAEDTGFP
jgi:uncharacterized membrane protein